MSPSTLVCALWRIFSVLRHVNHFVLMTSHLTLGTWAHLTKARKQELLTEAAEAFDIHYPWSVRLLLVEADGRGATELLDERFFATVHVCIQVWFFTFSGKVDSSSCGV